MLSAMALDPANPELSARLASIDDRLEAERLYKQGLNQLGSGQYPEAYESFGQALVFQPDYADAKRQRELIEKRILKQYLKEAAERFKQQELDEAIALWDDVLRIDPQNQEALARRELAEKLKTRLETQ